MAAFRSFPSLISDWNMFRNGCCLSAKQFFAYALHKRMKPCREQRKANSLFRTYFFYGFIPFLQQKHNIYITYITLIETKFYGQGKIQFLAPDRD